jgi:hypothetical protein
VTRYSCGHVTRYSCGHVTRYSCGHVTRYSCGHALDEAALHYIQCRPPPSVGGGNLFTSVHDAMLREVANMLCTVYAHRQVVAEDYVGAMSLSPLRRPDMGNG